MKLSFYFDYLSPYAYFGWLNLGGFAQEYALEIDAQPVLFAGLLGAWGQLGPAEIPPKREFVFRDCARIASRGGFDLKFPPKHPFNPLMALRVSLREVAGEDQNKIIAALFHAVWGAGLDIGEPAVVRDVLEAAGLDGQALLERSQSQDVKDALRLATETAIEKGVFGVPTFVIDEELFWGNDQFRSMHDYVAGNDSVDEEMRGFVESSGPSIVRKR